MNMSIIVLISMILLTVNGQERAGNQRYQPRQQPRPRGQMGFKWSRQYARGSGGFGGYKSNTKSPETEPTGYTQQGPGIGGLGAATPLNTETQDASSTTNDGSEPTLNIEGDDELPPPQIVIDNATEAEIEPFITTTSENIDDTEFQNVEMIENTMDEENMHQPPIMDCLYNKCQDPFNNCYNDEKCKEFMREWQEIQSLAPECLPKTEAQTQENEKIEIENTEFPIESTQEAATQVIECEYDELFWNTYNCGVQKYCYNDQLALVSSHQYILSPSNFRVQPNVTGTSKSSFNYTLLLVAVTSGISAVILVEVLRRLYTGLKDKCKCKCEYECLSLRYLKNKWEQIRGYKYEKTHADIDAIEEEEDEEMYGRDNETSNTNTNIGVTYNGPINDDSDISDDEELQKTCTSSKAMSLDQQTDEDGDIVTDNEDLIVHSDQFQRSDEEEIIANNDEEKDKEEEKVIQEPVQQL